MSINFSTKENIFYGLPPGHSLGGKMSFGNSSSKVSIDKDGILLTGDASCWDDLRVSAENLQFIEGIDSPFWGFFKNDGTGQPNGQSIIFSRDYNGKITTNSTLNCSTSGEFAIALWFLPEVTNPTGSYLFYKAGAYNVSLQISPPRIVINSSTASHGTQVFNLPFLLETRNCLVISVEYNGTQTLFSCWINGVKNTIWIRNGKITDSDSTPIYIGGPGTTIGSTTGFFDGRIDEFKFWNTYLSDSEALEFYNSGLGTSESIVASSIGFSEILQYKFDGDGLNTGTSAGSFDLSFQNVNGNVFSEVYSTGANSGLLEGETGSLGLYGLTFINDIERSVFFNVQIPHNYKLGSNIYPHLHGFHSDDLTGICEFQLEYCWVNILDNYPENTTIISSSEVFPTDHTNYNKHLIYQFPVMDGTGKGLSSMLMCRLSRIPHVSSYYTGKFIMFEFDFHYEVDSFGSKEEYIK